MDNWYLSSSTIHGIGVFTNKYLQPDSYIDIGIGRNELVTFFGSKINHSWTPSCKLVYNSFKKTYDVYSIKELYKDDEITLDYTFTPSFILKPDPTWK